MIIEQQDIDQIRQQFAKIQTKKDLVALLNVAKGILYKKETQPFRLKDLTYHANPALNKKRYTQFSIKKKSGGERIINAPAKGLKSILRALNFVLQCVYEPHKAATGFVRNKSIIDNAKIHIASNYVYNIDLKDFFHSFDRNRVKMAFMYTCNLGKKGEHLAFLLACLTTHPFEINGETKIVLPQGSPTSPTITNILCQNLDRKLTGLAKRFGVKYSRYADDMTFSSSHSVYKKEDFLKEMKRIIEKSQKLTINPTKTRLQKAAYRQEVTGLIVNEKVNVRRRYLKKIRMLLHLWERDGYVQAQRIFQDINQKDKKNLKNGEPDLLNVLDGKLNFLSMVKGVDSPTYITLQKRFVAVYNKLLNNVLNTVEEKGIEEIDLSIIGVENAKNKKEIITNFFKHTFKQITDEDTKERFQNLIGKKEEKKENPFNLNHHKPKEVSRFLSLFRGTDHPLKYLVHDYTIPNTVFDYREFIDNVSEAFLKEAQQNYFPYYLKGRIGTFIGTNKKRGKWYFKGEEYDFSFKSKKVEVWCKANPKKHPIHNDKFLDKIHIFNSSVRIDRNLQETIRYALAETKYISQLELKFDDKIDKATFQTDIDALILGLKAIFNAIGQRIKDKNNNKNKVVNITFQAKRKEGVRLRILKIIHLGSECTQELSEEMFRGDLNSVKNSFYKLCDWSIISKNSSEGENKDNKLNILYNPEKKSALEKTEEDIEGFTHILTFYS